MCCRAVLTSYSGTIFGNALVLPKAVPPSLGLRTRFGNGGQNLATKIDPGGPFLAAKTGPGTISGNQNWSLGTTFGWDQFCHDRAA